ncbi:MAG: glycine/sarcosine/betaine reductase complex component C subunit beta [Christensenellales bacterium]
MNSVLKAASYVLVHAPDMVLHNGTTQTTEMVVNPDSEYLKNLPGHLRSYDQVVAYAPNQTYIGNMTPEELGRLAQPWTDKPVAGATRQGKYGEIMPQDEFLLLFQACDMFDLVHLERDFVSRTRPAFDAHPLMDEYIRGRVREGTDREQISRFVNEEGAEGIYHQGQLVGYIKRAHDVDANLSAHVMMENMASKASAVLALKHLIRVSGVAAEQIDYVIECSEEACGDMNQRGGGNFAKSIAEIAGLSGATGCDVRGFCAAPAHALVNAAALVKSGAFKNVAVVAGGSTAKLGMNGKDHVRKGMQVLEDVLGGFAALISANDGLNPEIDLDIIGRHTVGTGASPQAVITSLVLSPLEQAGMRIQDIDKYAAELQNPDITKPAGAGDVPQANFKMIGALAVKSGELARDGLNGFIAQHGMAGWAPTQGHIPSGAPYLGFARQDLLDGKIRKAMIVGKGSLFLGRLTNQFDGISFVLRTNSGDDHKQQDGLSKEEVRSMIAEALRAFAASLDA